MKKLILLFTLLVSCESYYREEISFPTDDLYQCEIIIKNHLGSEVRRMEGNCDTMRSAHGLNGKFHISIARER